MDDEFCTENFDFDEDEVELLTEMFSDKANERNGVYILNPKAFINFHMAVTLARELCDATESVEVTEMCPYKLNGYFKLCSPALIVHENRLRMFQELVNLVDSVAVLGFSRDEIELEFRVKALFVRVKA